jgi:hypothetical protein
MKHQVWLIFLFVSFSLRAQNVTVDKLDRIGRFSYEDSFDENLVEVILKKSSASVKKNVKRLLYPDAGQEEMQRLLLLGGKSNASTTAIAKAIAVRCGYEYYLIEASALLQAYREGRHVLLNEVRAVIKQGKPVAIIITELPEMADYSGLLASTLWLLIDQCAQYPDVFVIATSAFKKEELLQEIKDRFKGDIISVALDKSMRDSIEGETVKKMSWLERNKGACLVVGGLAFFALGVAHLYAQILFADAQAERDNARISLKCKAVAAYEALLQVEQERCNLQRLQCDIQCVQYITQVEQHGTQNVQTKLQFDKYFFKLGQLTEEVKQKTIKIDQEIKETEERIHNKRVALQKMLSEV